MKIGILRADDVRPELAEKHGEYPQMIAQLMLAAQQQPRSQQFTRLSSSLLEPTLSFTTYHAISGEFPPKEHEVDGYILTGSKFGVYDDEPWIKQLIGCVQRIDADRIRLVGICFGHQLIAQALGGVAEKSTKGWGIGVRTMQFSDDAPRWGISGKQMSLVYSHQDQVTSPVPGSLTLAGDAFCPYAMNAIGSHILTFQGHPEFSETFSRELYALRRDSYPPELFRRALASLDANADNIALAQLMIDFFAGRLPTQ